MIWAAAAVWAGPLAELLVAFQTSACFIAPSTPTWDSWETTKYEKQIWLPEKYKQMPSSFSFWKPKLKIIAACVWFLLSVL